jgi:hypothetical protein
LLVASVIATVLSLVAYFTNSGYHADSPIVCPKITYKHDQMIISVDTTSAGHIILMRYPLAAILLRTMYQLYQFVDQCFDISCIGCLSFLCRSPCNINTPTGETAAVATLRVPVFHVFLTALLTVPVAYRGGITCTPTIATFVLLYSLASSYWLLFSSAPRNFLSVTVAVNVFKLAITAIQFQSVGNPPATVWLFVFLDAVVFVILLVANLIISIQYPDTSSLTRKTRQKDTMYIILFIHFMLLAILSTVAAHSSIVDIIIRTNVDTHVHPGTPAAIYFSTTTAAPPSSLYVGSATAV